ncbi:MAG: YHS domain protein [Candidatus Nitronauta litoralis]|uniref:YHS domain protein n=1 Tax=Candidatus Nitronauta litoralis TaxID=2705533 RepID=A0A7T0FZU9_9BACT|nr:MAG: YHS domain protein [Candidatus Nitronauta litoralis]
MKSIFANRLRFFSILALVMALTANIACAGQNSTMKKEGSMKGHFQISMAANSIVGVQGYDLVSYRTNEKPLKGNGNHVVEHHGITYLFINKENQQKFAAHPHKYLPAFGGYCAYGVAVGKKFVGDPDVWKIVDNTLYLNLDNKIQGIWNKDISGNIQKAENNWVNIKDKNAADL